MAEILMQLRAEKFNQATEAHLASHPLLVRVEGGDRFLSSLQAFAGEQFRIQKADMKTIAHLFSRTSGTPSGPLFKLLLDGELFAQTALPAFAAKCGVELESYETKPAAQVYSSVLARLGYHEHPCVVAAACAVNFPAWGRVCRRLAKGLRAFGWAEDELAFLEFFATEIPRFDEMAAVAIERGVREEVTYADMREAVRHLQAAECLFWDSIGGVHE